MMRECASLGGRKRNQFEETEDAPGLLFCGPCEEKEKKKRMMDVNVTKNPTFGTA
jgi:hypothetical protein